MRKKLTIAFAIVTGLSLIGLFTYDPDTGKNALEDLDWLNNGIGLIGATLAGAFIIYAAYRGVKGK